MADGLAWDDLTRELEGPGVGIRRMDAGGLAACVMRRDAGVRTDPLFAGLPNDRCQYANLGCFISGTIRVHDADGARDFEADEPYCWEPGHNLEVVTDADDVEITGSEDYDALRLTASASCRAGPASPQLERAVGLFTRLGR